jgi:hypothetical protein
MKWLWFAFSINASVFYYCGSLNVIYAVFAFFGAGLMSYISFQRGMRNRELGTGDVVFYYLVCIVIFIVFTYLEITKIGTFFILVLTAVESIVPVLIYFKYRIPKNTGKYKKKNQ